MPLPTFTTSREEVAQYLSTRATLLKQMSARWRGTLSNDSVEASFVVEEILTVLMKARDDLTRIAAKGAAAAAYYADQTGSTSPVIVAAFTELQNAINAAISVIVNLLPKASTGTAYLQLQTIDAQGARVWRQFTPVQTAQLRTALQAVEAAILDPT